MKMSADTKMKNKVIAKMPTLPMVQNSMYHSLTTDLKIFPKSLCLRITPQLWYMFGIM